MSESTERPILFNSAMVRAILNGTKTQTRRGVRLHPELAERVIDLPLLGWCQPFSARDGRSATNLHTPLTCPLGKPGDTLWVRETWAPYKGSDEPVSDLEDCDAVRYAADEVTHLIAGDHAQTKGLDMYCVPPHREMPRGPHRWRPSIHMPRWASRITLEVTEVRAQRLQDIDEADATREGFAASMMPEHCAVMVADGGSYTCHPDGAPKVGDGEGSWKVTHVQTCPATASTTAREFFAIQWRRIYGAVAWDANPWVWAASFKRI